MGWGGLFSFVSERGMVTPRTLVSFGSNVPVRYCSSVFTSDLGSALRWLFQLFAWSLKSRSVFEVCPIYLDSLFDVVTQTADPLLSCVADCALLPDRFPLVFDCLGPCLPLLWSVYCLVLSKCADFAPCRLATLASCLHVVSCRLRGLRLLPALNPAMAAGAAPGTASPSRPRSSSRSRTPLARPPHGSLVSA